METHVKVLGALQIALGALCLLGAIVLTLVFVTGVGAIGMSGDPEAARALPFVGFIGTALVVFLIVMSLPGIVTGIGLLRLRPWARILGIVMSALGLVMIPFGTLLGIYGLWVLLSKDAERLFTAQVTTTMPTPLAGN
jgi:hypothetical protein